MKIVTIIGARPQFIKAAVVSRAISDFNQHITANPLPEINEVIVHTGQHYDRKMSDVFFEEMDIPKPDYFLDINGLSHGAMTGQMLEKIEPLLVEEKPDIVLVYGDTNTTLAGALAAAKLHITVAHVEAGLRSFNRKMPEEINRVLTDHIANFLFCPTKQAVENLKAEGIIDEKVKADDNQLENCLLVMTDSVGLQKEAFFFKKPCITMRDETEWVELVAHGFNSLAGADTENIYDAYKAIIDLDFNIELYGDGKAGERIVDFFK